MSAATFRVHEWINGWEEELKNPDDLFFYMTIGNVTDYLLDVINSQPTKNPFKKESYELKLLLMINRLFSQNDMESRFVNKHCPISVNKIQAEYTMLQDQVSRKQRPTPDIKKISSALRAINRFYNNVHFSKEIENEIMRCVKKDPNSTDMRIAMFLLLRSLITKHSPKFLTDLPSTLFSKSFLGNKTKFVIKKIIKNKKAVAEFDKYVTCIVKASHINARKYSSTRKSKKLAEFIVKKESMRPNNSYWTVQKARDFLHGSIPLKDLSISKEERVNQRILDKTFEDASTKKSIDNLLQYCMEQVCSSIIYKCIGHLNPQNSESKTKYHKFNAIYADIFKHQVYGGDSGTYANFYHPILTTTFYAVEKTYASHVSAQLLKRCGRSEKCRLISVIKDAMQKEINKSSEHYFRNEGTVVDRVVDSFDFVKLINQFLQDSTKKNISDVLDIVQNTESSSVLKNRKETLEHQSELFSKDLTRSTYYRKVVPHEVESKQAIKFFKTLFKEIRAKKKFRVFCLIGDLNCNDRVFRLGGVNFYDARKWEFGEGSELDHGYDAYISSSQKFRSDFETYFKMPLEDGEFFELKKNSGRAYVDLTSTDQRKAIDGAMSRIRDVLSTLVYAASANEIHTGFQPLLPSHYVVLEKNGYSSRMGRDNTPQRLGINKEYDEIIRFYDEFLTKRKTKYDESILRSFRWFQKGRLENVSHEKFLAFWIAIEQLILTNTKHKTRTVKTLVPGHRNRLFRHIPHLSVTWRNSKENWVINRFLQETASMISPQSVVGKYLHHDPERRRWKENYAILLENLPQLKNRTRKKQFRKTLEQLQEHLSHRLESIIAECTFKLHDQRFKVARLYEKRNLVIHEGFINDDELVLMTKTLERLLLDVLRPILKFREGRTINQIAKEINRPYPLRYKKII